MDFLKKNVEKMITVSYQSSTAKNKTSIQDRDLNIVLKNCALVLFLVSYRTREPVVSEDETEYYIIRRVEQTREIMPMLFLPSKQIKEKVLFLWQKILH